MALLHLKEQMTIPTLTMLSVLDTLTMLSVLDTLTMFSVLDVERKLRLAYKFIILLSCLTRWQHFKTCSPGPFREQRLRLLAEYIEFLQFVDSPCLVIVCIDLLPLSRQVFAIGQSS